MSEAAKYRKTKKAGIIAINKYSVHMNFGAVLHSYAFHKQLEKMGVDHVYIDYFPRFLNHYHTLFPIINVFNQRKGFKAFLNELLFFFPNFVKYARFQRFFKNEFPFTAQQYTQKSLGRVSSVPEFDFDTIIAESDVIWSPHSTDGFDDGYFCNYPVFEPMKKVAYACCIGNYDFSDEQIETFTRLVNRMDYTSIREAPGAEFTRQYTDKPVELVLDPTMLLDPEDYRPVAKAPKEKGYLLCYNCLVNDKVMVQRSKELAAKKGLRFVELSNFAVNQFNGGKVALTAGIEEFLGYFENADFVVTNAFHGTCFAVVYGRDFYTFARSRKDSRMISILTQLDILDRFIRADQKGNPLVGDAIDYDAVRPRLAALREESLAYLQNALDGVPSGGKA